MLNVRSAGLSDIGLARSRNEDYFSDLPDRRFYVVADGMGGHPAGDIASQVAIEAACQYIDRHPEGDGIRLIAKAIEAANESVYSLSCADRSLKGMGTTICCLLLRDERAYFGHVGDSRIYLQRGKELSRLTEDHSLVAQLVQAGQLKPGEEQVATYKHVVTRAVGTRSKVLPTLSEVELEAHDRFLLCTDGLSDQLSRQKIGTILTEAHSLEEAANQLIEAACEAGGEDNVTVLLVEVG